jgi:hypothetical protein
MLPIESICWTSRAQVCDLLVHFLRDTPPAPIAPDDQEPIYGRSHRSEAASLLASLGDSSFAPFLRQLLLNPQEEQLVRVEALYALREWKVTLPAAELEQLLADSALCEEEICCYFHTEFLTLCRSEEGQAIARRYLGSATPVNRAEVLRTFCDFRHDESPWQLEPSLQDWLYFQWLHHDRLLLETDGDEGRWTNLKVAVATRARTESVTLLHQYWREGDTGQRRRVFSRLQPNYDYAEKTWVLPGDEGLLRELLADCADRDPATFRALLDDLELPLGLLFEQMGAERLLSQVLTMIEAANQLHREDRWEDHTEAMDRAYHLLLDRPEANVNGWMADLLCRPDPSPRPRQLLYWVLWERERDLALAVARRVALELGDWGLVRQAVRRTQSEPRPNDRDFLFWAAGHVTDPEHLGLIVRVMDQLEGDEPRWHHRLQEWASHPDPRLRVRTQASLVRRGEEARLPEIVREATEAPKVAVRATALAELGRLDAEAHFSLLRHALLHDHPRPRGFASGDEAASAAAVALAWLGTPEAMTALLQGCLSVDPNRIFRFSPGSLLARSARQQDGMEDPLLKLWANRAW